MTNFIKKMVNGGTKKAESSCCSVDIKEVDATSEVAAGSSCGTTTSNDDSCCGTETSTDSCCGTDSTPSSSSCCG